MANYRRNRGAFRREQDDQGRWWRSDDYDAPRSGRMWRDYDEGRGWNRERDYSGFRRPDWVSENYDDERGGVWSETWGRGYENRPAPSYNSPERERNADPDRYGRYQQDDTRGRNFDDERRQRESWWRPGQHTGRGPQGYQRSDERIREDVNERLTWHGDIDATHIQVTVNGGEVTLEGQVEDRRQKRLAEDLAEVVFGVKDVHNHLHVEQRQSWLGEVVDRITGDTNPEDKSQSRQNR